MIPSFDGEGDLPSGIHQATWAEFQTRFCRFARSNRRLLTITQISKISNYFKDKPVLKAYLFGSLARDEADEKSDVDILVELDYSKPVGLEFIEMQLELQDLLNREVDLLSEKAVSKYIKPYIEQDKFLIYAQHLKPLPALEGYVTEGWKDATYE